MAICLVLNIYVIHFYSFIFFNSYFLKDIECGYDVEFIDFMGVLMAVAKKNTMKFHVRMLQLIFVHNWEPGWEE